jgi:hypothetical protein
MIYLTNISISWHGVGVIKSKLGQGERSMEIKETIDNILSRFSHKQIVWLINDGENLDYSTLDVIIPWKDNGENTRIVVKFFISKTAIVVNMFADDDPIETYIGSDIDSACSSIIQMLWKCKTWSAK